MMEIIECEKYPIKEVIKMIDDGIINDSKSICAIQRARK